jgi:two-component system response regulator HydG
MSEQPITKSTILVVEDEQDHAQVMCEALTRLGHRCDAAFNLAEAISRMQKKRYDVIITDLVMDGRRDGMEVLKIAKGQNPPPPVILVTAHGDIPTAVQAMNQGAYDFIEKPLDLEAFRVHVNRAAERAALVKQNQNLQDQLIEQAGFEGIIGKSEVMQKVVQTARQVAGSDIPVLIMGESGTGKELIARAIHNNSRRSRRPVRARRRRHAVHGRNRRHARHHAGQAAARFGKRRSGAIGIQRADPRRRPADQRHQSQAR